MPTPLGMGCTVHRLNTGYKETRTVHRAMGREQGVTAPYPKPWAQVDFRIRIFEVLERRYSYFLIYLFIYFWLCWVFVARLSLVAATGATLLCSAWASHCSGFSCGRESALGHSGSVVVARGLSCPEACEIFPN